MPIENERKFVLRPPYDGNIELEASELAKRFIIMEQAYLKTGKKTNSIRIRKNLELNKKPYFQMTVKQEVNGNCVEIETDIDEIDYNKLWSVSVCKLKKYRYILEGNWEIDFFKNNKNNNYFGQAEIELPEEVLMPDLIHPYVSKYLLYKVEKTDNRFTSKKLSNINYTDRMLIKLLHSKVLIK
jgi:CYTH domain-containing protein